MSGMVALKLRSYDCGYSILEANINRTIERGMALCSEIDKIRTSM